MSVKLKIQEWKVNVLSRTLWAKRDNASKQKTNVNKYVGFYTTAPCVVEAT